MGLVRKPLVLPLALAERIEAVAARAGRRTAWPIEAAWESARARIAALAAPLDIDPSAFSDDSLELAPQGLRSWLLEPQVVAEIDREAARLDCSASTVVLHALVITRTA